MTGNLNMNSKYLYLGNAGVSGYVKQGNVNGVVLGSYVDSTLVDVLKLNMESSYSGSFYPTITDRITLGTSALKFNCLYASTGSIVTSDKNKKTDIEGLDETLTRDFIMGLEPSSYKLIDGDSGRTHYGFIAQDIEALIEELGMSSMDFAGFIKSPKIKTTDVYDEDGNVTDTISEIIEGEYDYALRYEEFIAPLIKMVQVQQNEIQTLKTELEAMKAEIAEIKNSL